MKTAATSHDYRFFSVRELPSYGWVVDRPPAVCVVAHADDGRVWLCAIDRKPIGRVVWEVPGGGITDGEGPVEAAVRELREECGLSAERAELLTPALEPMPGMGAFAHHVVEVRGARPVGEAAVPQLDEGVVEVRAFTRGEIGAMARRGEIIVMPTLASLLRAGVL